MSPRDILYIVNKKIVLYFIVFIRKLYKRQAKIYHNACFTIFTQKRIQDEKKKMKREREEERQKEREKVGGGGIETYYNVNNTSTYNITSRKRKPRLAEARWEFVPFFIMF